MPGERSKCPAAHVLDIVGDRWTLLVIRDIGILGKTSFGAISASPEHIPPSTLTSRLDMLLGEKLVTKTLVPGGPGRQYRYLLTERGKDLLPIIGNMFKWSARHDPDTVVSPAMHERLENDFDDLVDSWRSSSDKEI